MPYNGDPNAVVAVDGAADAITRLRGRGIPLAVVSNQSGIGRGLISASQVEAVNRRVDELIGPFDLWLYCPHAPHDNCECRKPKSKLIEDAARALGVKPECCVVIGDKQSDLQAARNAGARPELVAAGSTLSQVVDRILAQLP